MKLLVSDKANWDLLRTYSYLAQRSPTAAESVLRRIDEKFNQLLSLPFIGRERPSLAQGLRSVVVGTLVIFYTVGQDSITIVRVIDGRMDEEFRR
jgi:toxin ParE1/3/4